MYLILTARQETSNPSAVLQVLPANLCLEHLPHPILDLLVGLLNLLFAQRAVERLIGQRIGQTLAARGNLVAVVEVE